MDLLNGHHSMKQRHLILKRFHDAGPDDARVLLMSAVGTVGLNITCVHIVIFLVSVPPELTCSELTPVRTPPGLRKTIARPSGVCGASVSRARCWYIG